MAELGVTLNEVCFPLAPLKVPKAASFPEIVTVALILVWRGNTVFPHKNLCVYKEEKWKPLGRGEINRQVRGKPR